MPFFSVIIPVYKVEDYLKQCVDSVLSQEFKDIEIILVDDGSPDNCPKMCDDYAKKDNRIKVIHKTNGGLSDARNFGIKAANGKYILFLDSDDYWDNNKALYNINEYLLKNEADILIFLIKHLFSDGHTDGIKHTYTFDQGLASLDNKDMLKYLINNDLFMGSACHKALKREFIINNDLFFIKGLYSEDIEWSLRTAIALPSYAYYDDDFYVYRQGRDGSITQNYDYSYLTAYKSFLFKYMDYQYKDKDVKENIFSYLAYQYVILCALTQSLKENKKQFLEELKERKYILKYDLHPKVKKANLLFKTLPFNFASFLFWQYIKYR